MKTIVRPRTAWRAVLLISPLKGLLIAAALLVPVASLIPVAPLVLAAPLVLVAALLVVLAVAALYMLAWLSNIRHAVGGAVGESENAAKVVVVVMISSTYADAYSPPSNVTDG